MIQEAHGPGAGAGRRGRGRGRFAGPGGERGRERTTGEQRQQIAAWFAGRLPEEWFTGVATVEVDDDEIVVTGDLSPVELAADATDADRVVAEEARIGGFREDTRGYRMRIAEEAQHAFRRVVSWGAACGDTTRLFTTTSVPVMTRLRQPERAVLDTLIDGGVARSRSDALAWCVRLVARNEERWIADLRAAFEHVEQVRDQGPDSASG